MEKNPNDCNGSDKQGGQNKITLGKILEKLTFIQKVLVVLVVIAIVLANITFIVSGIIPKNILMILIKFQIVLPIFASALALFSFEDKIWGIRVSILIILFMWIPILLKYTTLIK